MGNWSGLFFLGRGGGGVVRCQVEGVIKEKPPDFRFPEVGISEIGQVIFVCLD